MNTLNLLAPDLNATIGIANQIGSRLRGHEIIELVSDLGGGKTTFVRGLAKGMGYTGNVRSPSFSIEHIYKTKELSIHHLDFYRLTDAGILKQMLSESMEDASNVIVIEWAEIVENLLPKDKLLIDIKVTGMNERQINLIYPDKYKYLLGE